ncbi:flagellar hook-length control protein FliK [Pseudomonas kielensis]|jgi:flagellar hook-length control protein FliK|uniref:flagellar hook-length control protein FliK n=1 Tax=Pseudomonas kielensis TaxID=2762577 RepID=UPI00265E758F|nr:flagellar hook-length control protein FliK [Pseudomonas kielensis]WKL53549.1 flagellar hook-length control protein FliK [Pseudomonas kielensis]
MPLSPNILLQAGTQAKSQSASANAPATPVDKASGFARVFAGQGAGKSLAAADVGAKPLRDKVPDHPGRGDKPAASAPAVAASGKTLPAEKVAPEEASDTEPGAVVGDAAVDPAQAQAATPAPVPVPVPVVETPATVDPAIEAALLATTQAVSGPAFDPEADPLDSLPAVRLAMEQSGHLSASSQAQAKTPPATAQLDGEPTTTQTFAAGMASMLGLQAEQDGAGEGGEKAFSGLIDEGLKDLKAASSDTRVEGFADRLAALTQAATAKTANALPVNQPIAMHQSGWTEEVVNRVMYLSSANLKAADIQLQPAELGRLDIRVNMIPDQQTQVTFMSAHVGVREALDGQMHRLREMFAQQGMGQVDVNVSDQSRGSQEQAQQGQGARTSATANRLEPMADESPAGIAEVAASATRVMGSSVVDYYA